MLDTVEITHTTTADQITDEAVQLYRSQGFIRVRGVLSPEEVERFREAALRLSERMQSLHKGSVFTQLVNAWREDEVLRELTLHPKLARIAEALAGVPLRLWHDQVLIKQPQKSTATEFHQDQPYWPHARSAHSLSAWVALCDVPVERGCMTFIPRSHTRTELAAQNLEDPRSLFSLCPDLEWDARVTLPLRAGDCTFHHSRCAHMANPNVTHEPRVAHVIIYMDADTVYTGQPHVVTDPLALSPGQTLEGELFPRVGERR